MGYRLCRMKIINLRGERPGLLQLTFRLLVTLAFWNPFAWVDLLWVFSDPYRQALHDKWAET